MEEYTTWSIFKSTKPELSRMARNLGVRLNQNVTQVELADLIAAHQNEIVGLIARIKQNEVCPKCGGADVQRIHYSNSYVCRACNHRFSPLNTLAAKGDAAVIGGNAD